MIGDQNMDDLLQRLRSGLEPERVDAAKFLGDTGDRSLIPALKEVLEGLTPAQEETVLVPDYMTDAYESDPNYTRLDVPGGWGDVYDSRTVYVTTVDPDQEIREAIAAAICRLERR
jgi:hypothetical protein